MSINGIQHQNKRQMKTTGYARVSTKDQNLKLQLDALTKYGCNIIYQEKASTRGERPKFREALDSLKSDDTLVVYKLDRLGRSLKEIIMTFDKLGSLGVNVVSIKDSIDTTSAAGKLMFHMIASFAEFERDLIRERTMAGLKASNKKKGRMFKYHTEWVRRQTKNGVPKEVIMENPKLSKKYIDVLSKRGEQITNIKMSKATYYRIIKN